MSETQHFHVRAYARAAAALRSLPERAIHLIIGTLQGFAVYALAENNTWLSERLHIVSPIWILVLVWPPVFLLSFTREHIKRATAFVSGFVLLLALLAAYTSWQAIPGEAYDSDFPAASFLITMLVAVFVALIHLQPRIERSAASYEVFFTLSWRNFLTVGFSLALMLGVRLVLFLWESLFAAIGVDVFKELFDKGWFIAPVLGASFAFGLYSFRAATSIIDSVSTLLMRLTWLLLPILMLLLTSFLVTLPFVGLGPLWDTDYGTLILMATNLLGLFFVNAVYQTGAHLPYSRWPHLALTVAVALLPIISTLACYGLLLRVGQHGWSTDRLWAMLVVVLMACFSIGYAYIIARQRTDWFQRLREVNRHMSWVVLVSLLLTASPLLDFRVISAWSLFSRFESGAVDTIDLEYVRVSLGKPGHKRLKALQANDPTIVERMEGTTPLVQGWTPEEASEIATRPVSLDIPEPLSIAIKDKDDEPPDVLIQTHLDDDNQYEYVSVWAERESLRAYCWTLDWTLDVKEWTYCGDEFIYEEGKSGEDLLAELLDAEIDVAAPKRPYKDMVYGKRRVEFE